MAQKQCSDSEIQALFDHLENQGGYVPQVILRYLPDFFVRRRAIYKSNITATGYTWLLVVSEGLRQKILDTCLDQSIAGHLGYSTALARMEKIYFWPTLPETVPNYLRS